MDIIKPIKFIASGSKESLEVLKKRALEGIPLKNGRKINPVSSATVPVGNSKPRIQAAKPNDCMAVNLDGMTMYLPKGHPLLKIAQKKGMVREVKSVSTQAPENEKSAQLKELLKFDEKSNTNPKGKTKYII